MSLNQPSLNSHDENVTSSSNSTCKMMELVPSKPTPSQSKAATGWQSLPEEIKLQIIRYNLKYPNVIVPKTDNAEYQRQLATFSQHINVNRDIARLSHDVFYKENTFLLASDEVVEGHQYFRRYSPRLPHPSIRPLLRKIVWSSKLSSGDWGILRRLSRGEYGVTGLKEITIEFDWTLVGLIFGIDINIFLEFPMFMSCLGMTEPVVFSTEGKVVFRGQMIAPVPGTHWTATVDRHIQDEVEANIREKLRFKEPGFKEPLLLDEYLDVIEMWL
ncbi:hypothetical protein P280DRAFT_474426 [Massarina eburnea CBS 473.64]|uniref:Uncharacterized protein n=1 Tax=Massarina eburnea CBS 473.64 TaxID=1395130 RepID=A0A6A6RJV2_9PLEO|nr:hypothetical protein P280DRAFT_474426 [Massarina eburnea CBS 473.64]